MLVDINLVGTFNVMRLAAFAMLTDNAPDDEGERGVLINTASVAAFDGQIGQIAYSATKGGVVGMTLPAARDLADKGIRVVHDRARASSTRRCSAALPEDARASLGEQVPFPQPARRVRPSTPSSPRTSSRTRMLNGETIRLDGAIRMAPR